MEVAETCPSCGGKIKKIHPYYGAEEKEFDLIGLGQFWMYIPASLLSIIWWPLGVAGIVATYAWLRAKAKSAVLYECSSCGKQFSASQLNAT